MTPTRSTGIRRQLLTRCGAGVLVLALAGCGGTSNGGGGSDHPTGARSGPASSAPRTAPVDPAGLASFVARGIASTSSAFVSFSSAHGSAQVAGIGTASFAHGQPDAFELQLRVAAIGNVALRLVNGIAYVQLPGPAAARPWHVVRARSSDATVRALVPVLASVRQLVAFGSLPPLIQATTSLAVGRPVDVNEVPATQYQLLVAVAMLPVNDLRRDGLLHTGSATAVVDLSIDAGGRPVAVAEPFLADGSPGTSTVNLSKFGLPVHVGAPPASQIAN